MRTARGIIGRCIAASVAFAGLFAVSAAAASASMVSAVRLGGDAAATRLVVELSAAPDAVARQAAASPDAVRLEFIGALGAPPAAAGRGLVREWSLKPDARGVALALTLAPGARVVRRFALPPADADGPWRYVVDIGPALPAAAPIRPSSIQTPADPIAGLIARVEAPDPVLAPASGPAVVASVTAPPRPLRPRLAPAAFLVPSLGPLPPRLRKVVVIDAGHGGHDPGAQGSDRDEKDINLAAARALAERLRRSGRYKVVMTRDDDTFIPLPERVRIARRVGADLFISLHSDSSAGDPDRHGASVYTLSDSGQTRVNTVLGPDEWFARAGSRRADPRVSQILLDLTQRSTRNRSAEFADLLVDRIGDKADLLPRTRRDAGYFVLLAPDVPAVLLEMGFISNPLDVARLTDPARRDALMEGVARAIDAYFAGQARVAAS